MLSQISHTAPSHNPAIDGLVISPALLPLEDAPAAPDKEAGLLNALTIIVHDLRGPLANLALMIELIETHAQMRALDRVTASSRKAQDLIASLDAMLDGFLQRARETGDPLSFTPALLDVANVVREAVALNQPVAESREIAFDCTGLESGTISGDAALL